MQTDAPKSLIMKEGNSKREEERRCSRWDGMKRTLDNK
jgi:hypothetical protein